MKDNNQWIWIIVAVGAVLLISSLGFGGMGGYGMMGGFGMGMFGWLFMGLIITALVLLIVWLIKQIQEPSKKR